MNFRPLHDRVMVKREDEEDVSKGGIIIPDTAKEKPMHAKVVAVGSGIKGEDGSVTPLDVKISRTAATNNLSAIGSKKVPKLVTSSLILSK